MNDVYIAVNIFVNKSNAYFPVLLPLNVRLYYVGIDYDTGYILAQWFREIFFYVKSFSNMIYYKQNNFSFPLIPS